MAEDLYDKAVKYYDNKKYHKAFELFTQLAEQGNYYGQNGLGVMYEKGGGVAQDYVKAVEWYRKSAEQGYAIAQCNLGNMYYRGRGVEQDYTKAVECNLSGTGRVSYTSEYVAGTTAVASVETSTSTPTLPPMWM